MAMTAHGAQRHPVPAQMAHEYGGAPRPPKIIINGTPFPDLVRMELDFGRVGTEAG
jgi:hypothetical protein